MLTCNLWPGALDTRLNKRDLREREKARAAATFFLTSSKILNFPWNNESWGLNVIRKWELHFDGKYPWAYLERFKELWGEYKYPEELLLRGLSEVLRGDGLLWYRNTRDGWRDRWDFLADFKTVFLPHHYRLRLQDEIQEHKQKAEETNLRYSTTVLSLSRAGPEDI